MKFTAATLGAVSMAFALIVDHLMDHLFLPSFVPAISGWRFQPVARVRSGGIGPGFIFMKTVITAVAARSFLSVVISRLSIRTGSTPDHSSRMV
jgi:hypothetical protein